MIPPEMPPVGAAFFVDDTPVDPPAPEAVEFVPEPELVLEADPEPVAVDAAANFS
jgi:hypothetical protein